MKNILVLTLMIFLISCGVSTEPEGNKDAPANLTAFCTIDNQIQLNWEDRSSTEIGFVIERETADRTFTIIDTTGVDSESYIDENVQLGSVYLYRVFALFNHSVSEYSNEVTIEITSCSPTDLTAFCTSSYSVQLNWEDRCDFESGFILQRKDNDLSFVNIDTLNADSVEFLDDKVETGNSYTYRIAVLFEGMLSSWSNEVSLDVEEWYPGLTFGSDSTFDVVTWNIENFPKQYQTTVDYLTKLMLVADAEIYALQEIESNNYFNSLVAGMNLLDVENNWEYYRANSAAYNINLAFIYKSNEVQVNNIYEIFEQSSRPFPRSPLVMNCIFEGEEFVIIDNHYKALGNGILNPDDLWDEETRRLEASTLLDDYIKDNLSISNVIVLGDLNDELNDIEENNVFMPFINKPQEYEFTDMDIALGPNNYWSYPGWHSHLDHILITNELFDEFANSNSGCETILIDEFLDGGWYEYENYISDHRPVGLNLDLN